MIALMENLHQISVAIIVPDKVHDISVSSAFTVPISRFLAALVFPRDNRKSSSWEQRKNSRPRSFLVPRAFHAHIFLRRCSYQVGDVLLRCNIATGGGGSLLLHCSRYSPETQALRLCRRGGLHSFRWVIKWASLYCRGLFCLHSQKNVRLTSGKRKPSARPVTVYITMRMKFLLWYKLTGRKRQEPRDETLLRFRWTNLICDFIVIWKNGACGTCAPFDVTSWSLIRKTLGVIIFMHCIIPICLNLSRFIVSYEFRSIISRPKFL